jgi:DNA-binding transcriptional MerR regulator
MLFPGRSRRTVIHMPVRYLTTSELSHHLGIAARTIQGWRKKGLITPALVTAGGQARWIEQDVRDQLRKLDEQRRRDQE